MAPDTNYALTILFSGCKINKIISTIKKGGGMSFQSKSLLAKFFILFLLMAGFYVPALAVEGKFEINQGKETATSPEVLLTLYSEDAGFMQFSNDGANWTAQEVYCSFKDWRLSLPEGKKTVFARFLDSSGKKSSPIYSRSIILSSVFWVTEPRDLTASPGASISIKAKAQSVNNVAVVYSCDWFLNGRKQRGLPSGAFFNIGSDGTATLFWNIPQNIVLQDRQQFQISARAGASSLSKTVSVKTGPLYWVKEPASAVALLGTSLTIQSQAKGRNTPITYSCAWYHNGTRQASLPNGASFATNTAGIAQLSWQIPETMETVPDYNQLLFSAKDEQGNAISKFINVNISDCTSLISPDDTADSPLKIRTTNDIQGYLIAFFSSVTPDSQTQTKGSTPTIMERAAKAVSLLSPSPSPSPSPSESPSPSPKPTPEPSGKCLTPDVSVYDKEGPERAKDVKAAGDLCVAMADIAVEKTHWKDFNKCSYTEEFNKKCPRSKCKITFTPQPLICNCDEQLVNPGPACGDGSISGSLSKTISFLGLEVDKILTIRKQLANFFEQALGTALANFNCPSPCLVSKNFGTDVQVTVKCPPPFIPRVTVTVTVYYTFKCNYPTDSTEYLVSFTIDGTKSCSPK
jgi:hypothetical protein